MTAVPQLRDDETIREALAHWLTNKMPPAADLTLAELERPQTAGGSNETLLATVRWTTRGQAQSAEIVLRIAPTMLQVFFDPQFEQQYRTLEALREHTDIPVPGVWGYEPDDSLLGAPFWVMDRLHGDAPTDFPPYNQSGFLVDATAAQREQLWLNAVETLGAVHRLPAELFPFLGEPATGSGLQGLLSYWKASLDWASEGQRSPTLEALDEWLVNHQPIAAPSGISWGDARIGNMLFRDWRCVAVLDWEMVSLAGPLVDLGWWLLLDEALSSDIGLERLSGLGSRADTIAVWEQSSGLHAGDLLWYEAFAGFRLAVILLRGANIRRAFNVPVPKRGEFGSFEGLVDKLAERFDLPADR
jgi:aminoglycoside phosphotransferase (APT) family kinase protein